MDKPDAELAARCRSGDSAALEALYRRYVDRVWRYGYWRTGSREAAAEIVQDTFVRVAASIGKFEGRSAFATWLFAVTRSAAVARAQRERRTRDRAGSNGQALIRLVADPDDPPDPIEKLETRRAVRAAVQRLSAGQRDVVVLCEFCGLTHRQAAETLGWGRTRVKVTLFRARRKLRELLNDYVTGEPTREPDSCGSAGVVS